MTALEALQSVQSVTVKGKRFALGTVMTVQVGVTFRF